MTLEACRSRLQPVKFTLGVFFLLAFLAMSLRAANVNAQALVAGDDKSEEDKSNQPPFLLPAQPPEITEAMEDFRRFVGRKQWEKAFKHLEKVFSSTSDGLVLTADGIMLPSRMIAREALLELPAPGQDAYRLFCDAEAKKLLDQAQGKEELTKLSQIFSRYLVTSAGDVAADKLGDLHFEAGELDQAINAWKTIIEQRPDSPISRGKLRTKIGVALARQRHWGEFEELMKIVEQQHLNEKMTIGGKEVLINEHLRAIAERGKASPITVASTTVSGPPANIPLPVEVDPLWQFRFFPASDPDSASQLGLHLQNRWGWGGNQGPADWIPPVAIDSSRVYLNFVGYDLGIDLDNGKLLWRTGRFFDANQKAQQGGLTPLEQHGLAVGGGRVWSVAREGNDQQNRFGQSKFGITSREPDTGKKVFSSQDSSGLSDYSVRGTPLVDGERIYLAANKTNQNRELEILALNTKDGKLLWSAKVGSYTTESNPWMIERTFQPSLLLHGGRIYVDTHSGSLVQIDATSGQVQWGLNYVSEAMQGGRFWWWGGNTEQFTAGVPQIVDGILYLKGMRSQKLYAVDPQRPRVVWHRPISRISNLIGVDESRFYLGGDDISAYDLKTRKIVWSVKVHMGTTWAHALLTQDRIYHFSARGIYEVDKTDGKVVRVFRGTDLDSMGGNLIITPKALLAISNLAVTAYPFASKPNDAKLDAASAAAVPADRATVNKGLETQ